MTTKICSKCSEERGTEHFRRVQYKHCVGTRSVCRECESSYHAEYVKNNPDKIKQRNSVQYQKQKPANKKRAKERYHKNREEFLPLMRAYKKRNPSIVNAINAKRRAAKLNATVGWSDKFKIALFYAKAKRLGIWMGAEHDVDHIVPLVSDFVCGLHCEANLQILLATDNRRKSNTSWPNIWET